MDNYLIIIDIFSLVTIGALIAYNVGIGGVIMIENNVNRDAYCRLLEKIDTALESKCISYAQFSKRLGITAIAFYNNYKSRKFSIEEMTAFLEIAESLPVNLIRCLKCNREFMPRAKSVKRAVCDDCRNVGNQRIPRSDSLRFNYPEWVTGIKNWEIKNLVKQEYHIDEETALAMSNALSPEEARAIRANRWRNSIQYCSSLLNNSGSNVALG